MYSGVYGRAASTCTPFNSNGNRGIACGLNNLQKISDGEPLGGKSRAEDDFATRMTTIIFPETTQGRQSLLPARPFKKMRGKRI